MTPLSAIHTATARRVVIATAAATAVGTGLLLAGGAQALPAGDASAQAVVVDLAPSGGTTLGLAALATLQASTPQVEAPASAGQNSSTVGLNASAGLAQAVATTVTATATRSSTGTSSNAQVSGVTVDLFGTPLLTTGVIDGVTTCTTGSNATAQTSAADVRIGGTTVDAAAGASADVGVTVPGLTTATVSVAVAENSSQSASAASATGLVATLMLHGSVLGLGAVDVPLGSVTLAAASCTTPAATAAAPTVSSLSPTSGPTYGGQTVTATGTGFDAGTTVTVGGVPATGVVVSGPTSLTFVTPAAAAGGAVSVVVTSTNGSAAPKSYTYVAPTITRVSPNPGPSAGGQQVTVTGTGFAPAAAVSFDGVPATGVVVSAGGTTISATTPAHAAGPVDVTVSQPGADATLPAGYTYVTTTPGAPAPTVTGINPDLGPVAGGQQVTLTGSGFAPGATVTFDGVAATGVTVSPDGTTITATTPAHAAGPVDVTVSEQAGDVTLPAGYTYQPPTPGVDAPTLSGLTPDSGPTAGGQTVTLTGTGFVPGATTVTVGGLPAPGVTVTSPTTLTITTPPADAAGPVPVVVTTVAGSSAPQGYTYVAPRITAIDPDRGSTAGGQRVTVSGTGFAPGATVTFGGDAATDVTVSADGTTITATTPAHAAGPVDVTVAQPGADASLPNGYTFVPPAGDGTTTEPPPTLTGVSPGSGPIDGGTVVTVTGTGFVPNHTTVTIGGKVARGVHVVSSTELTAVAPADARSGMAMVRVATPEGSASALDYRYLAPAVATTPQASTAGGGTLPFTGFNVVAAFTFGLLLLTAGGWFLQVAGRVRSRG